MGKLKEKVFNLIDDFITKNREKDYQAFNENLQNFINSLTLILNKNSVIPLTHDTKIIYTDGSSLGNPGKARIGIIIKDHLNKVLLKEGRDIGVHTNNQAEYIGIIEALNIASERKYNKIILYSDSEVAIKQINGQYLTRDPELKKLNNRVKELEKCFKDIKFIHVLRGKNKEADKLSR